MKRKFTLFYIALLLLLLSPCTPESTQMNGDADLKIINLQVTPALTHWLPAVASCANPIGDFGVYTQIVPPKELNLDEADLIFRMGEPREDDPFTAVMGIEKLVVIAGEDVPLSTLSVETLQAIYAGLLLNWGEIPEIASAGIEMNQPIQPFSYPEGHELRNKFEASYLNLDSIDDNISIFSTLDRLQSLLTADPFSIAYLLESQVPEGFQTLSISGFNPQSAQVYVLAVTKQEPAEKLRQLLLCLQDSQ